MKHKRIYSVVAIAIITILVLLVSFNSIRNKQRTPSKSSKEIYLYGEAHGVGKILDKELELWNDYYHNKGMRHLFIELPYYTAEYLNIWMKSETNEIFDKVYDDWNGTSEYIPECKEFYEKIKEQCPETVFHGTDVGHQYSTTGERFLQYLRRNNLEDSEQYKLTQEVIEQGKTYYGKSDDVYREKMMVKNFIREYDKLKDKRIMGIYGSAHTGLEAMDFTNTIPCMANQLKKNYGNIIHTKDLSIWVKDIEPYRLDTIKVNGKDYKAGYFGKEDISSFAKDYTYREYWRLENAYDDFKDKVLLQDTLPYDNYPMLIEKGQVFVIDYTKTDGTIERKYYRSDGEVWNNKPTTQEFKVD
ncbi:hypothetical protein [Anaeromicropila herbilytica]|uniref:Uncharacterized protein n=1 Tax=Anaeromicropila herbilytica TaxID=2785025 RepID=A0A7R7EIH4_9FIRM|nr:hypothetical protein [Anaeromicropila herbilytica]BCN29057.1 hypothetical protein bsdtb5_03520 [Anaeromicropila herbilytica]